jgi:hypothetical protein
MVTKIHVISGSIRLSGANIPDFRLLFDKEESEIEILGSGLRPLQLRSAQDKILRRARVVSWPSPLPSGGP